MKFGNAFTRWEMDFLAQNDGSRGEFSTFLQGIPTGQLDFVYEMDFFASNLLARRRLFWTKIFDTKSEVRKPAGHICTEELPISEYPPCRASDSSLENVISFY